jgi:two-component system chemotaxis sensor kinase CheA
MSASEPIEQATVNTQPRMDDEFDAMLEAAQGGSEASATSDLITDEEFEAMLDQMHGKGKGPVADNSKADPDLITDDEFEAVLDQMHGKGKGPAAGTSKVETDLITDDEFEAVLDQMHGKGKGPVSKTEADTTTASAVDTDNVVNIESASAEQPTAAAKSGKSTQRKAATAQAETSVRVDTARLDDIMNLVGELVLVRNRLTTLKQTTNQPNISDAISTLELVTSDLQSSVMKTRMQPIKKVFSRFPRVIRDLARTLKKDINLELIGEETDLDKSLVEALADPLIHLVRNAADHGIEPPQQRFESGKPRQGKVTLSAQQEGDQVLLTVSDDGKGMDHMVLRRKAVEKGMMSEDTARALSDKEAYNLIFAPGFSTKTEISDVSGRGVGMDVVKTRINELNGNVEIDSKLGEGSIIVIHLPLTLAILPTLMVNLDQYQFALPLTNVLEAFNMEPDQINVIDGQEVIRVRDKALPLFYLYPWLVRNQQFTGPQATQKVIVVQMGNQHFCLVVDHIAGQEEVVIKPLGTMLNTTPGFAGATITGDGSIALVLDVPSLMSAYAANSAVY